MSKKEKGEKKKGSCLKTILIVFGVLVIIGAIGSTGGDSSDEKKEEVSVAQDDNTEKKAETTKEPEKKVEETTPEEPAKEELAEAPVEEEPSDSGRAQISLSKSRKLQQNDEYVKSRHLQSAHIRIRRAVFRRSCAVCY